MVKRGFDPPVSGLDADGSGAVDDAALLDSLDSTAFEQYNHTAIAFVDSPFTSAASDRIVFCDATNGNIAVTSVAAGSVVAGYSQTFVKSDASANTVTVNAGTAMDTQYQWETYISDGASTWSLFRVST